MPRWYPRAKHYTGMKQNRNYGLRPEDHVGQRFSVFSRLGHHRAQTCPPAHPVPSHPERESLDSLPQNLAADAEPPEEITNSKNELLKAFWEISPRARKYLQSEPVRLRLRKGVIPYMCMHNNFCRVFNDKKGLDNHLKEKPDHKTNMFKVVNEGIRLRKIRERIQSEKSGSNEDDWRPASPLPLHPKYDLPSSPVETYQSREFTCAICKQTMLGEKSFFEHMSRYKQYGKCVESDDQFRCFRCRCLMNAEELANHERNLRALCRAFSMRPSSPKEPYPEEIGEPLNHSEKTDLSPDVIQEPQVSSTFEQIRNGQQESPVTRPEPVSTSHQTATSFSGVLGLNLPAPVPSLASENSNLPVVCQRKEKSIPANERLKNSIFHKMVIKNLKDKAQLFRENERKLSDTSCAQPVNAGVNSQNNLKNESSPTESSKLLEKLNMTLPKIELRSKSTEEQNNFALSRKDSRDPRIARKAKDPAQKQNIPESSIASECQFLDVSDDNPYGPKAHFTSKNLSLSNNSKASTTIPLEPVGTAADPRLKLTSQRSNITDQQNNPLKPFDDQKSKVDPMETVPVAGAHHNVTSTRCTSNISVGLNESADVSLPVKSCIQVPSLNVKPPKESLPKPKDLFSDDQCSKDSITRNARELKPTEEASAGLKKETVLTKPKNAKKEQQKASRKVVKSLEQDNAIPTRTKNISSWNRTKLNPESNGKKGKKDANANKTFEKTLEMADKPQLFNKTTNLKKLIHKKDESESSTIRLIRTAKVKRARENSVESSQSSKSSSKKTKKVQDTKSLRQKCKENDKEAEKKKEKVWKKKEKSRQTLDKIVKKDKEVLKKRNKNANSQRAVEPVILDAVQDLVSKASGSISHRNIKLPGKDGNLSPDKKSQDLLKNGDSSDELKTIKKTCFVKTEDVSKLLVLTNDHQPTQYDKSVDIRDKEVSELRTKFKGNSLSLSNLSTRKFYENNEDTKYVQKSKELLKALSERDTVAFNLLEIRRCTPSASKPAVENLKKYVLVQGEDDINFCPGCSQHLDPFQGGYCVNIDTFDVMLTCVGCKKKITIREAFNAKSKALLNPFY